MKIPRWGKIALLLIPTSVSALAGKAYIGEPLKNLNAQARNIGEYDLNGNQRLDKGAEVARWLHQEFGMNDGKLQLSDSELDTAESTIKDISPYHGMHSNIKDSQKNVLWTIFKLRKAEEVHRILNLNNYIE